MSESLGSDLDSGDNLDSQDDRSRDSDGDLLVGAEEDAWTDCSGCDGRPNKI